MTEREIQDLLRDMRDEPVPADSLARVRMGVDQRRRRVMPWKALALLLVAGCLIAGFLVLRPGKNIQQVSAPEIAQVLPPVEIPALPEIPARRAPRPKRARSRPVVEGVPVSIRIETADPEVVILLVN